MKLQENPFAILNASPRDDRRRLMDKADEAALLNGSSVDEALGILLKLNQRIEAELSWFPGTDPEVAEVFLRYSKDLSDGKNPPMPSLEKLACPLAQANALAAFFEAWPVSRPEYFIGLCRSMDRILSRITVTETKNLINGDRKKGDWERIPDELALTDPLESRIRELTQLIRTRMEKMGTSDFLEQLLRSDLDMQGSVALAVLDSYTLKIHDREEALRKKILDLLSSQTSGNASYNRICTVKPDVAEWCRLTKPLRQTSGSMRKHAEKICHDMRECIVSYFNSAPATTEKRFRTMNTFSGTQVRTVTYQSKKDACQKTIELSKWLAEHFPEQATFVEMLNADQKKLHEMIQKEESDVNNKLYS